MNDFATDAGSILTDDSTDAALRAESLRDLENNLFRSCAPTNFSAEIVACDQAFIFRLRRTTEFRDPETGDHIVRMAAYSRLIAEKMGLPTRDQELLLEAAPMHDVGKVGIPDYILLKPGKLNKSEFDIMKRHANIGHALLANSESDLMRVAAAIAYCHHEKFDGSGYPNGLKGDEIPLSARIVAVADVFDALTSSRPYKKAWSTEDAGQFIKEHSGSHFDPRCVDAFLSGWDEVLEICARFSERGTTEPPRNV